MKLSEPLIHEKAFFLGHFFSAWLTNVLLCLAYVFGIAATVFLGGATQGSVGPVQWGPLFHAYALFMVPNLLIYNAVAFFALVTFRKMSAVWAGIGGIIFIFIFMIMSLNLGNIEELRFAYVMVPGVAAYSELNGFGNWAPGALWYFLVWCSLACFFVVAALFLWRRSPYETIKGRLRWQNSEVGGAGKALAIAGLLACAVFQYVIVLEVYQPGNFIPEEDEESHAAAYEKTFGAKLEDYSVQPFVSELEVALYPEARRADVSVALELLNLGAEPIEELYVNQDRFTPELDVLWQGEELEVKERDDVLGVTVFGLPEAIAPDARVMLSVRMTRAYRGFPQSMEDPQGDLTFNGLVFDALVPTFGYDVDKTLRENKQRRAHDLDALTTLMAPVEEAHPAVRFAGRHPVAGETLRLSVSTAADQVPIAPGLMIEEQTKDGRRRATYVIDRARAPELFVVSARYALTPGAVEGLKVTYAHHPEHTLNLELFDAYLTGAKGFIEEHLGELESSGLRVVEIPDYDEETRNTVHLIALPESEGWFADAGVEEIRSYLRLVLTRELIVQWLDAQIGVADVQGADMLWTALPTALALAHVREEHGDEQAAALLKKMQVDYAKERVDVPVPEPSLLESHNLEYLEPNRGTIALYDVITTLGVGPFTDVLDRWLETQRGRTTHFASFYAALERAPGFEPEWREAFEQVPQPK